MAIRREMLCRLLLDKAELAAAITVAIWLF
jgi:hypothetical protein